jgi:nucleoside-diphosphate-sugar epimerase
MKIAITGSTGVLGKEFIKKFPRYKYLKYRHDILNQKKLKNWILNNDFDIFLHFAAIVPTMIAKKNYKYVKKINFQGTSLILDLISKKKNIYFLFTSTSHVYNYSNKPISEKNKTKPISKYGLSKLQAERVIKKKLKKAKINYSIARIFSFTNFNQNESYFVPGAFLGRIKYVNTIRDIIDIRDLCNALNYLIKKRAKGIFNVATGKKTNLNSVISYAQKRKIILTEKPKNNLFANIKKIKSLGWSPKYNIKDTLKDFKKKYKK